MSRATVEPNSGLAAYAVVTAAYWTFMLTDGALRMLVLLHFHVLGFDPIELAYLFLLYELMGVVTNLSAGWLAARFGLAATLYAGLALQVAALLSLTQLDPDWAVPVSVAFVMIVQGMAGVAKDLTKMSSKSAVKVLVPEGAHGQLFRWVALLTGSKNAVKGFGFLLGAGLLALIGFQTSVFAMAVVLAAILIGAIVLMPPGLPKGKAKVPFSAIFSKSANVNWLSAARLFLFGARDIWFVVGVPIYFYDVLSDGSEEGMRRAFFIVGGFMAMWIIGYGFIQAMAPRILKQRQAVLGDIMRLAQRWVLILTALPLGLAVATFLADAPAEWLTITLVAGLLLFGAVFAINSSLHSFLILALSHGSRVTLDVGFYYMSNASGRLIGTLLSGVSYQAFGLTGCLLTAGLFAGLSWLLSLRLRPPAGAESGNATRIS